MFSCKEATRLASEEMDRPLSLGEKLGLRLHLIICSTCRRFRAQLHYVGRAVKVWTRVASLGGLSQERREKIRQDLRQGSDSQPPQ